MARPYSTLRSKIPREARALAEEQTRQLMKEMPLQELRQVPSGRYYGSRSETARAGLRSPEEHERKLAALRQALIDGEESGVSEYSLDSLIAELDAESR